MAPAAPPRRRTPSGPRRHRGCAGRRRRWRSSRGAAHRIGRVGPGDPELDRDVAARGSAEYRQRQDGSTPTARQGCIARLLLGVSDPSERGPHYWSHALAILPRQIECRSSIAMRAATTENCPKRSRRRARFASRWSAGDEIGHFGRILAAERRWVEASHRPHRRALALYPIPQSIAGHADRRNRADTGYHDSAPSCHDHAHTPTKSVRPEPIDILIWPLRGHFGGVNSALGRTNDTVDGAGRHSRVACLRSRSRLREGRGESLLAAGFGHCS